MAFTVTYERVNEREAMHGGTTRHGVLEHCDTLHDAIHAIRNDMPAASERVASWPCDDTARWYSVESQEWETGDNVIYSIHFPEHTSTRSRKMACAVLSREL